MTRIQISLGNETLALVDRYADAIGVSRSALCSVLIAQGLMNYNPALLGGTHGAPPLIEVDRDDKQATTIHFCHLIFIKYYLYLAQSAQKKGNCYVSELQQSKL